jgi:polysaccharide biosynthesis/export protein
MPRYVIEAPDVLEINAVRILPKPPYHLRALDRISVQIKDVPEEALVNGIVPVNLDGTIELGPAYDRVSVQNLTPEEAGVRIRALLIQRGFANPKAYVSLAEFGGLQQIAGEHLVAPDGTVTLGAYGSVPVAGYTLQEAKLAIEKFLSPYLMDPEVAVDVFAYNSKVYYIVTQGAGLGDNVVRVPLTGNETVLDAISQVSGLQAVSSKKIWIARPTPGCEENIVLPVDWCAVTGRGAAATNYQIMPGDRVFIAEDNLVAFDNYLAKIISPMERIFGVTLLGTQTAKQIKFYDTFQNTLGTGT